VLTLINNEFLKLRTVRSPWLLLVGTQLLVLLGVPYRWVTGPALVAAMLAVVVSARMERRLR